MASILQQESRPARDSLWSSVFFWALVLVYFLWPYYDAPTFLLLGKIGLISAFLAAFPGFLRQGLRFDPKARPCLRGLLLAALGYLFFSYLSVLMSPVPWRTFKHVSEEVFLNLLVMAAGLFWASFASSPEQQKLKRLVLASYFWVIFLFFFFLLWWSLKGPVLATEEAPSSFKFLDLLFNLPNWHDWLLNNQNLATYFLFPASMALAYFLAASEKSKQIKGLFFFFLFLTMIFFTTKRSAFLGLAVGGLVGAWLTKKFRFLLFLGLFFLGLAALILATPLKNYFIREDFRLFFYGSREDWKEAGSIPWRYYGLPFYLDYIKKHPWRGIGFGRFNIKKHPETRHLPQKAHLAHAHNVFINMALYLGLPGAFFFLLLVALSFWCLVRAFLERDGPEAFLLLGFIIYLVAFWTRYQFDDSFRYATSAFYYLNSGLGLGLALRER